MSSNRGVRRIGTAGSGAWMWTGPLPRAAGPGQASSVPSTRQVHSELPRLFPPPGRKPALSPLHKAAPNRAAADQPSSVTKGLLMALPPRRRSATAAALLGVSALAVAGLAATGPATAAPSPKASPSALAAQSAAGLVASKAAALHASKYDAFIAHKVISTREGLQYVPYDRTHKGLPVIGGDFVVVTDSTGKVLSTSVAQDQTINLSTVATR